MFDHLDELTISQIDKLIGDVQEKMGEVQKEIGVDNAKISPVDMKVIVGKLGEAKQQIATLNPFRALGDSMKEIFGKGADEAGKSSVEVGDKWKNLGKTTAGCFDFVNDAVGSCSVLSDVLGESGQQTMGMIQGVATAGIAMSSAIKGVEKGSVILADDFGRLDGGERLGIVVQRGQETGKEDQAACKGRLTIWNAATTGWGRRSTTPTPRRCTG